MMQQTKKLNKTIVSQGYRIARLETRHGPEKHNKSHLSATEGKDDSCSDYDNIGDEEALMPYQCFDTKTKKFKLRKMTSGGKSIVFNFNL